MKGVFRHFQIVEDEAGLAVEFAHGGGDAVGFGANDADGEASQAGGVLGAMAGSDAATVLLPAAVEDVMGGLDGLVPAVQREQAVGCEFLFKPPSVAEMTRGSMTSSGGIQTRDRGRNSNGLAAPSRE